MSKRYIKTSDRSVLEFRPKITYVEPRFKGRMPPGEGQEKPELDQEIGEWDRLDKVAKSVNLLAQALQVRVDEEVGDFAVELDRNQDAYVIAALNRRFPVADRGVSEILSGESKIGYAQYRECRESLAEKGREFGNNALPTEEALRRTRANPLNETNALGFDLTSAQALSGKLTRPDLIKEDLPFEPVDEEEHNLRLLCMLVNRIWQDYFYGVLGGLPVIGKLLPESWCDEGGVKIPTFPAMEGVGAGSFGPDAARDAGFVGGAGSPGFTGSSGGGGFAPGAPTPGDDAGVRPEGQTDFQDCQIIIRAFEKGCAHSTDRRSVFALQTPFLQDIQSIAGAATDISSHVMPQANRPSGGESAEDEDRERFQDWMKDCIPCAFRISSEWEMRKMSAKGILQWLANFLYETFILPVLYKLQEIAKLFQWEQKSDPCALFNFFTDFVCIPDLVKILAALTALLFDISFILDGFGLDLMFAMVVPLLLPFLMKIIAAIEEFIMLMIEPLICIVDSAISFMNKLDFGGLRVPVNVTLRFGSRQAELPGASAREAANNGHKEKLDKWRETRDQMTGQLRSLLGTLVEYIQEAIRKMRELSKNLLDELMKIVEEFMFMESFSLGAAASQKLAILNLINLIRSLIAYFKTCKTENRSDLDSQDIANLLGDHVSNQGYPHMTVTQDEDGNIRIEQAPEAVAAASAVLPSVESLQVGDPAIDSQIAGIVEKVTTPVNVVYGCSRSVGVIDIQDINDWIGAQ